MTPEQAVKLLDNLSEYGLCYNITEEYQEAMKLVLSMLENQQERIDYLMRSIERKEQSLKEEHEENIEYYTMIEKKDKIIKNIIKRLDNDIKRITETKAKGYTDDYRRCRLKAYRTKTKEIKEYIEEQYFENKAKE